MLFSTWILPQIDPQASRLLQREHGIPALVADLLAGRGLRPHEAADLLDGSGELEDPFALPDMGKAAVAVLFAAWLGARFDPRMMPDLPLTAAEQAVYVLHFKYWAGLFCALGHMFPCTAKFKGGKGILCSGMLLLCLDWRIALVCWGLFFILWLTTRYVSLGSVSAAVAFPVLTQIVYGDLYLTILSVLLAALVIFAHRENIVRLLHGTENRFHFHVNAPEDKK